MLCRTVVHVCSRPRRRALRPGPTSPGARDVGLQISEAWVRRCLPGRSRHAAPGLAARRSRRQGHRRCPPGPRRDRTPRPRPARRTRRSRRLNQEPSVASQSRCRLSRQPPARRPGHRARHRRPEPVHGHRPAADGEPVERPTVWNSRGLVQSHQNRAMSPKLVSEERVLANHTPLAIAKGRTPSDAQ